MNDLVCSVDIDAPPKLVWAALVDLAAYGQWNPFIREATGEIRVGGRVRVRVHSSLRVPLVFHATVTAVERERELRWNGHVLAPWLGSGDHVFTLEPLGSDRTRFTQREVFTGALPRLLARLLLSETRRGFDAMNHALATRAEDAHRARSGAPSASV